MSRAEGGPSGEGQRPISTDYCHFLIVRDGHSDLVLYLQLLRHAISVVAFIEIQRNFWALNGFELVIKFELERVSQPTSERRRVFHGPFERKPW